MDLTALFWIPLVLLFLSAVAGAVVKIVARDKCLKAFDNCFIFVLTRDGQWRSGKLRVYPNCLELSFAFPVKANGFEKLTYIFYEAEMQSIICLIRPVGWKDREEIQAWKKQVAALQARSHHRVFLRQLRNFFNILRDAFTQSIGLIVGIFKSRTRLGQAPAFEQRTGEIGRTLLGVIPNAYEPILEKYIGGEVVLETLLPTDQPQQVAVLEEYTDRYILVRQLELKMTLPLAEVAAVEIVYFDAVFARPGSSVRHAARSVPSPL